MARKRRLGRPVDQKGRSVGEGQYAPLSYALLNSLAWRSLSGAAVKVFLELRTRFHGTNNGALILSMEEGSRLLGIGKATVNAGAQGAAGQGFHRLHSKGPVVWAARLDLGSGRQIRQR